MAKRKSKCVSTSHRSSTRFCTVKGREKWREAMEFIVEAWLDDDAQHAEEEHPGLEDASRQQADGQSGCRGEAAAAAGLLPLSGSQQSPGSNNTSNGSHHAAAKRPWFPDSPLSLPPPLSLLAVPVEWASGKHGLLEKAGPNQGLPLALGASTVRDWQVQEVDPAGALTAGPTISRISPLCLYVPSSGDRSSAQLLLSGCNLNDPSCEVVGQLRGRCVLVEKQAGFGKKFDSVLVTVHGLSGPGSLTIETRCNQLLCQSRTVLVTDCEAMCSELRSLEECQGPEHQSEAQQSDRLLWDLGSWLEHSQDVKSQPAGPAPVREEDEALEGGDDLLPQPSASAVVASTSPQQQGSMVNAAGSVALRGTGNRVGYQRKMMLAGLHLLEHSVESGWAAVSTRIVEEMLNVHGMSFAKILANAMSDGVPLLHRAIKVRRMQILHAVLRWGDANGHKWDWAQLAPTDMHLGPKVHVSALHLAAALGDGGYAGELLLLKYPEAREQWGAVTDSRGFLPCQYAQSVGNDHLALLAGGSMAGTELPSAQAPALLTQGQAAPSKPKLPGLLRPSAQPRRSASRARVQPQAAPAASGSPLALESRAGGASPKLDGHDSDDACCSGAEPTLGKQAQALSFVRGSWCSLGAYADAPTEERYSHFVAARSRGAAMAWLLAQLLLCVMWSTQSAGLGLSVIAAVGAAAAAALLLTALLAYPLWVKQRQHVWVAAAVLRTLALAAAGLSGSAVHHAAAFMVTGLLPALVEQVSFPAMLIPPVLTALPSLHGHNGLGWQLMCAAAQLAIALAVRILVEERTRSSFRRSAQYEAR